MKVLIVGSGGREHALAWKMAKSPGTRKVYIAPGNAGTAAIGENIPVKATDISGMKDFVKENSIDLTLVGPEQPLVEGIVDAFRVENLHIFGPRKNAARLEGSKAFAKDFMRKYDIPTAGYQTFTAYDQAREYLRNQSPPVVVKASGLAAGKGAIVCETMKEAEDALQQIMVDREFGDAGDKVVIEECLQGEEVSVIAITDGEEYSLLVPSQDHKAAYDGDIGPNTGGMGAYAPAPAADSALLARVESEVIQPTLQGMKEEDAPYVGFLYAGLMLTEDGPKVLEYNCRMGDPEAQVVIPLLRSDLLEVIQATMEGRLGELEVEIDPGYATCVVAASGGYPGAYEKGKTITGLDRVSDDCMVFHAGTASENGDILTAGGRVLGVTCRGDSLQESIDRTYEEIEKIRFEEMQYRTDIGKKGLGHLT